MLITINVKRRRKRRPPPPALRSALPQVRTRRRVQMAGLAGAEADTAASARIDRIFEAVRKKNEANRTRAEKILSRSGVPFPEYAAELGRQATVARNLQAYAKSYASMLPSQRADLDAIVVDLVGLAQTAAQQAAKTPKATITPRTALNRVERLYDWLDRITRQTQSDIKAPKPINEVVSAVTNAPGTILGWAGDQLKNAFGIPKWVIPTVGGVLLLGLAAPIVAPALRGLAQLRPSSR